MQISDLSIDNQHGRLRASAQVTWEESDSPPILLFIETDERFASTFWPDPDAFLLACVIPAWHRGERRVSVAGALCPVLCRNIRAALAMLKFWYPEFGTPPEIVPALGFEARRPGGGQAVSLLSCGVDSLATLRLNRLLLPADHPASIAAAIPVIFQKSPGTGDEQLDSAAGRLSAAGQVAADSGVELAPVRTNLWWLVNDGYFYDYKWHGALLSSLAMFFGRNHHKAYIAASFDAEYLLMPWGSSPLLDPYYSSAHFQIEHHGLGMARFDKTALIVKWPAGLNSLRVCQRDSTGSSNCGTCEKCIRTMTALTALGTLADCQAFSADDVSPALLETIDEYEMLTSNYQLGWYRELIPPLRERGRDDLVSVIQRLLRVYTPKVASH